MVRMQNLHDAVPPIFADGPSVEDEEGLRRWFEARAAELPKALLRVPFTFQSGTSDRASLGLPRSGEQAWTHRLDDSALGISLADRLRTPAPSSVRFAVWLTVRPGPLAGIADLADLPVVSVFAVHERNEGARVPRRAQSERGSDCLALRLSPEVHCARGSRRCRRCQEAAERPPSPALLDLCPEGPGARPTVAVERCGETKHVPYEVLRRFDSEGDARSFAARHGLLDVRLGVVARG